jgi:hypothetical protein
LGAFQKFESEGFIIRNTTPKYLPRDFRDGKLLLY